MRWIPGLLMALGVTVVQGQTLNAGVCCSVVRNYDYYGNDLASIKVSGSEQAQLTACCDACANQDGCAGFVVNTKTCYMKSKMVQSGANAGLIAASYMFTSNTCSTLKRNIDYSGNDIKSFTVKGDDQAQADLCCDACSNTISCIGWVVNGNTCWLKNKMVYSGDNTGLLSGMYTQPKITSGTCGSLTQDVDFSGNDIKNFAVTGSPQDQTNQCCDACSKQDGCVGFVTYSNTCWLKKAWVKSGVKLGAMAGTYTVPSLSSSTCSTLVRDVDYNGNDITSFTVSGSDQAQADACCAACSNTISCIAWVVNTKTCIAWVVNTKTCWLKYAVAPATTNKGLIAGQYSQPAISSGTCGSLTQDVDYSGNDIKNFAVTGTPQDQTNQCCSACSSTLGCIGFVTHSSTCWLKHAWVKSGPKFGAIAGTYAAPLPTSKTCSAIVSGVNYPGNDIATYGAAGSVQRQADYCCSTCSQTIGCVGWVLNNDVCYLKSNNTCWLKNAWVKSGVKLGAMAGTFTAPLPTSKTCSAITRGFNYPGNDITSFTVTGVDQDQVDKCCSACSNTISCVGWIVASNKCWLKNKMGPANALANALSGQC
ncbi:hypothetical protein SDRG_09722 [Saprolegnia diclina VS20]|uniref:Apple domain-containing protein n=1 Tax=Saprolegnia diclina (strain VS20) TaxID=1156394 RepID=T0QGJ1_SAPDV|nr:hypothetical protein SDRG_09722 [Saprolegnia diclina VS20]EQC32750.1 hypothetical protein SDRG_09722 [Saprolegnia diclina VS20]|eukprot:XP_008613894.1 hypothetical protein SDRG_09722 [Saprolegnia diclina VS20]